MRARDPHDDPSPKRRPEACARPPGTLGHWASPSEAYYLTPALDRPANRQGPTIPKPAETAALMLGRWFVWRRDQRFRKWKLQDQFSMFVRHLQSCCQQVWLTALIPQNFQDHCSGHLPSVIRVAQNRALRVGNQVGTLVGRLAIARRTVAEKRPGGGTDEVAGGAAGQKRA